MGILDNRIKLDAAGRKKVKPIVAAAYPTYTGRKVSVEIATRPMDLTSTWDEGSKDYFVAVDLNTLKTIPVPTNGGICEKASIKNVAIPVGVAIVERTWFLGKDCGITIWLNPADAKIAKPAQIAEDIVDAEVISYG